MNLQSWIILLILILISALIIYKNVIKKSSSPCSGCSACNCKNHKCSHTK
ncbi:MAG: FeoB-associated Cys-rich membrane protein [Tissierellia bacterium]|nr:FeoB-associated Cys-rich membrane protein [Tissierellia bacterium]